MPLPPVPPPGFGMTLPRKAEEDTEFWQPAKAPTPLLPVQGKNAVTGLIALLSLLEPDWEEIAALFPHGETDGTSLGISCADSVSGALTASFDVLSYRAPDFTGTFDIRFPLGQNPAARFRSFCARRLTPAALR